MEKFVGKYLLPKLLVLPSPPSNDFKTLLCPRRAHLIHRRLIVLSQGSNDLPFLAILPNFFFAHMPILPKYSWYCSWIKMFHICMIFESSPGHDKCSLNPLLQEKKFDNFTYAGGGHLLIM